jgi:Potential Queuosine, Q, salvage protein family
MVEIPGWYTDDDEDPYPLHTPDELGVLSSTHEVVEQGEHVWINKDQVEPLCDRWIREAGEDSNFNTYTWYDRYHFHDGAECTVNWLLVLDALNFCFWAEKDQPRWRIEYQGETLDGYWAEAAALTRAVEEGIPLWDAGFLSKVSSEELAHIFRGEHTIPLFEERLHNLHEVGQVLLERYDGQFARAVEQASGSAVKLVLLLAENFPSFHDVALYRKREVRFFKRAQICIADLHGAFGGKGWGAFHDFDQLTAFADYKLPQVLRQLGVLEYHPALAERIDNQDLLEPGGQEEVELRAATIWACELIRREMIDRGHSTTAAAIDQRLWFLGQNASIGISPASAQRPYHRVRTIYY